MSRIRISHTTTYRYEEPVVFGIHRLVIRPREGHYVQVENLSLRIGPAGAVSWHRDIFENSVALASFSEPADALEFSSEAIVVRRDHTSHRRLLDVLPVRSPVQYSGIEGSVALGYLDRSIATRAASCKTGRPGRSGRVRATMLCMSCMRSMNGSAGRSAIVAARIVACKARWRAWVSLRVHAGRWPRYYSRLREALDSQVASQAAIWIARRRAQVRLRPMHGRRSIFLSMVGLDAIQLSARELQRSISFVGSVLIRAA